MPRFIRSACLADYVPVARSFGLDPYRLLKEAGLDRSCLIDPEIKIPVGEVCHLLEISARVTEAEDFGLRMSEARRLSALGPLALAMRDAGTLREALQSASRYVSLHIDSLLLSLKEMDNLALLEIGRLAGKTRRHDKVRSWRSAFFTAPSANCLATLRPAGRSGFRTAPQTTSRGIAAFLVPRSSLGIQ